MSQIQFFNTTLRKQNSYIHQHHHSMYELVYYVSSSGHTTIRGTRYPYSSGQFAVIAPGVKHDEFRSADTEVIYFGFLHSDARIPLATGVFRDDHGRIGEIMKEMIEETKHKRNHFALKLDMLLQFTLIEADRLIEQETSAGSEEKLRQTVQYMGQYYTEPVTLMELAKMSGYSYDHFRHLFKAHTGMTPMNYITHLRIEKAKDMLLERTHNITQISLECGYSSLSYFSSMFKKKTGLNPREYPQTPPAK
ncbi:MAG: AraC family transcriptional regulator [Paenibacillus sp.]|nr:AraC family transcriptional regulator [Paenibacillus sp.]